MYIYIYTYIYIEIYKYVYFIQYFTPGQEWGAGGRLGSRGGEGRVWAVSAVWAGE